MFDSRWAQLGVAFVIVAVVSGAGWICLQISNAQNAAANLAPYSPTRIEADRAFNAQRWEDAAELYESMIGEDPYNGAAYHLMGYSLVNAIAEDSQQGQALAQDSPEEQLFEARISKATDALESGIRHRAQRRECKFQLARLKYWSKDLDSAINLLRDLMSDDNPGNITQDRLQRDFPDLIGKPEFEDVFQAGVITRKFEGR